MESFEKLIEITLKYVSWRRKYMINYTMLVGQPCYVCVSQTTKHGECCCGKLQFHHKRHLSCDLEDFSKKNGNNYVIILLFTINLSRFCDKTMFFKSVF